MPASRKRKPALGTTVPKAVNCQAEPEPIQPEEVLPPKENTHMYSMVSSGTLGKGCLTIVANTGAFVVDAGAGGDDADGNGMSM
jgi:hypothetical protein